MTQPIHQTNASGWRSAVRKTAFLLMMLVMTAASAQQKPTTGYATVNGINMYYEVHGPDKPGFGKSGACPAPYGEPVVLLHGAFMTITNPG